MLQRTGPRGSSSDGLQNGPCRYLRPNVARKNRVVRPRLTFSEFFWEMGGTKEACNSICVWSHESGLKMCFNATQTSSSTDARVALRRLVLLRESNMRSLVAGCGSTSSWLDWRRVTVGEGQCRDPVSAADEPPTVTMPLESDAACAANRCSVWGIADRNRRDSASGFASVRRSRR